MLKQRYLASQVRADIKKKMVFIGGPRQVGKTTLSKAIAPRYGYLNWDEASHRERILKGELPSEKLLIFDELHKYRAWRNWLKGKFDTLRDRHEFLVTGSARLDFYRYSGDSLQGRYFYYRLHPFSVHELGIKDRSDFRDLLNLSGFPEPFLSGSATDHKRWSRDYRTRLFREDIQTLERVDDIGAMELLVLRLPDLVGSPLSVNNLREDLQISHKMATRYLDILERTYAIFRVPPLGGPKIRAVKKERKHYHFDWALVKDAGKRLENLVASHLLKWVHFREDSTGDEIELRYFRDSDGREVDFVVTEDGEPTLLIEVKTSTRELSPHLKYLLGKFPKARAWQIHAEPRLDFVSGEGIRCCPAWTFLNELV